MATVGGKGLIICIWRSCDKKSSSSFIYEEHLESDKGV